MTIFIYALLKHFGQFFDEFRQYKCLKTIIKLNKPTNRIWNMQVINIDYKETQLSKTLIDPLGNWQWNVNRNNKKGQMHCVGIKSTMVPIMDTKKDDRIRNKRTQETKKGGDAKTIRHAFSVLYPYVQFTWLSW